MDYKKVLQIIGSGSSVSVNLKTNANLLHLTFPAMGRISERELPSSRRYGPAER